jgi:hypothetical protein
MRGTISFHPVDVSFFDDVIAPLLAGQKINPDAFLAEALRVRAAWAAARCWSRALATLAAGVEAPVADPSAGLWTRIRTNLERMDHRPADATRRAAAGLEPALHLEGRPFFVTEGSAERVAEAVESYRTAAGESAASRVARAQLSKMDEEMAKGVDPEEGPALSGDPQYRQELLSALKDVHDLARKAREGGEWRPPDAAARPAIEVLLEEIPWRAVRLHARAVPFWIARDVDGLETICRAAGIVAPDCLVPAWRLFAATCATYPELKDALRLELSRPRDVGAFVGPAEISQLLEFLASHGTRIIGAAARAGEGPAATLLLRKIKECATYAARRGFGYLEAVGIEPPDLED